MDTMATRSSEPVPMILVLFLKDNYHEKWSFGCFNDIFGGIIIPFAYAHISSFSGSIKNLYPMTVCYLCHYVPGPVSIVSLTGKKLPAHGRHVYYTPEV